MCTHTLFKLTTVSRTVCTFYTEDNSRGSSGNKLNIIRNVPPPLIGFRGSELIFLLRGSSTQKKLFCSWTDFPEILEQNVKLQGEDILFVYSF